MTILDDILVIGQRMKSEQFSLKESIAEVNKIQVTDEQVDGLDRLIYNHCLNKTSIISLSSRNVASRFYPFIAAR